ncbi:MAG: hypothetical protein Q9224_003131 [Gallowayella concinna]
MSTPKSNDRSNSQKLPLSHNSADSQASALRLVLTLFPDWEHTEGKVEFIRFKEGITNTLLKAVKRRPGHTERQIDDEAVLIRAYGKGTAVLIDRERESQSHSLLCKYGLAPDLLARFQNGLMYRFIRGQVCESNDLTQERIWRGVARRLAEWHAVLPVASSPTSTVVEGVDVPLFEQQPSKAPPSAEAINGITPGKATPNVWTVMQKWIFALPAASETDRQRNDKLQQELERTVNDLADIPSLGTDGLIFAHCDLLSGNVIVHPRSSEQFAPIETVSFIDYEYATPAPAAFDIANHFAEWGGFECNYEALPTRSLRRAFIEEYLTSYGSHTTLPSNTDEGTLVDRLLHEPVDITSKMKYIHSSESLTIPDNVKVHIKSRLVAVEGPRGKLQKDLSHLSVCFSRPNTNAINIELHHGSRKNVATLRTVKTLINNLIIGVTRGFKYKMRYVYAHFPINVNIEKNSETGLYDVEIRNFLGEKIVRRVTMHEGVDVEISKAQKDELTLTGNSLENVSQSAADIQQICRVRNKDIRKFLDGLYVSERTNIEDAT